MRAHPLDQYLVYQAIIQTVKRIPPPLAYGLARNKCLKLFRNYAQYLVDYFILPLVPYEKLDRYFSPQIEEVHLTAALEKGKGVLLLTGHLGNWGMGGILLRSLNYPLNIVTLPQNTERANGLIKGLRQGRGSGPSKWAGEALRGFVNHPERFIRRYPDQRYNPDRLFPNYG